VDGTGSGMCPMVVHDVDGASLRTLLSGNFLVDELLSNNKQPFVTGIQFHLFVGLLPA
jgi:hypothetical protein